MASGGINIHNDTVRSVSRSKLSHFRFSWDILSRRLTSLFTESIVRSLLFLIPCVAIVAYPFAEPQAADKAPVRKATGIEKREWGRHSEKWAPPNALRRRGSSA